MADLKTIAVLGATGTQGGSVVSTFLEDRKWKIRGITRNIHGSKAKSLSSQGVEMVAADLDNVESLISAFNGIDVIFAVTDFWKPMDDPKLTKTKRPDQQLSHWAYEYELQQGKNIFDAASRISSLERLIFSTIADVAEHSNGKYKYAYHADTKTHAERYGRVTYPNLWEKTSTIQIGVYLTNFNELATEMPKKEKDGSFAFVNQFKADTPLPLIAAEEDTGPLVKALLHEPPGTKLMAYRAWTTFGEFVNIWSRVLNVKAHVVALSIDEVLDSMPGGLDPSVRAMLAEGMANMTEYGYKLYEDPALTQPDQLKSATQLGSIEAWIQKQDWNAILNS